MVARLNMPISLVVVESHQHVLEHVHFILRRRLRTRSGGGGGVQQKQVQQWSMLHFDSHPDLACPNENIPAAACFIPRNEWSMKKKVVSRDNANDAGVRVQREDEDEILCQEKKNLYELLDTSQGGIAEWILPIVFAGGLDEVFWIKNEWCHQFQNGCYEFHVGAYWDEDDDDGDDDDDDDDDDEVEDKIEIHSFLDLPDQAVVKSSLMHPYYIDDNSYVRENELLLKERLKLIVSEVDERIAVMPVNKNQEGHGLKSGVRDWILDVCLDYFFCANPFLDELQNINVDIANLFLKAVNETRFRQEVHYCQGDLTEDQYVEYKTCLEGFNSLVRILLNNTMTENVESTWKSKEEYYEIHNYYPESEQGKAIWDDLVETISNEHSFPRDKLVKIMLDALPNLSLPRIGENTVDISSVGRELSPFLQLKVKQFGEYLRRGDWMNKGNGDSQFRDEPMLITMARSSDDGYTPSVLVVALQSAVLNEIHSIYCDCSRTTIDGCKNGNTVERCKLNVVFDYGEYEGSSLEETFM